MEKMLKKYLADKKKDVKELVKLLTKIKVIGSSAIKRPIEEIIATQILDEAKQIKELEELTHKTGENKNGK